MINRSTRIAPLRKAVRASGKESTSVNEPMIVNSRRKISNGEIDTRSDSSVTP